ncbi:putative late blight resistance protein homolog r1a-6 [Phtheirospermum japonicum]|uniref:Putative late blight resistance protein homolog r1a-6 n=1 Tax=Phtheirospermum japonicum TaxID=374723 RepID=A0A830B7N4_9LAMI|nr:putative late blight resistance protein homolog r1a-6 [Phtheirospermum japonicum]
MNIVEQIQDHPRLSFSLDKEQIDSLREIVCFLQDFIDHYSHGVNKEAEVIESEIASAAHVAEDVIESHVVDQILAESTSKTILKKILAELNSIKEKVMKQKILPTTSIPPSSRLVSTGKNVMVGFEDELVRFMELLVGQQSNLQIISVVGMGGIGKTTLTKAVYEKPLIVQQFDIRAWAMITHNYSVRKILLELLSCLIKEKNQETEDQIGKSLYQSLCGRRYLIVLDAIWSMDAWDKIRLFFPDNDNRSRVVVTTRLSNLAVCLGSSRLMMRILDQSERCPLELEGIGKEVARRCRGLPLSIVVIGGLLGKSDTTREYWENVAKHINRILDSDEHCLNILSLSYSQLPAHLKPCFLYMGSFLEDDEIRVSQLIKLWVAEGFLKPNNAQCLEDLAEGCLNDLVDRNLIVVCRWGLGGRIKTCKIHSLVRKLCSRIAKKEEFLCVMNGLNDIPQDMCNKRRLVLCQRIPLEKYHPQAFRALRSASLARSLICKGGWQSFGFRLLRVLNAVDGGSLDSILEQVNLRYLAYQPTSSYNHHHLSSSIYLMWNLQSLIIKGSPFGRFMAPLEIWEMPQLRHVEFDEICLPYPPQCYGFVLGNLQTLVKVVNFRLSEEVCKRIPSLKKLRMKYDCSSTFIEKNMVHKTPPPYNVSRISLLLNLRFPSSLQKLTLEGGRFHWEELTTLGMLPHLKVLKLGKGSVKGTEWNPVDGEFRCLKFLRVDSCQLTHWNADSSHFPVLETLVLLRLPKLNEIPLGIGEIPTLQLLRLEHCSDSAALSAMKILEEQESFGNEGLQVRIRFGGQDMKWFKEKIELELESFTSNNFQLEIC